MLFSWTTETAPDRTVSQLTYNCIVISSSIPPRRILTHQVSSVIAQSIHPAEFSEIKSSVIVKHLWDRPTSAIPAEELALSLHDVGCRVFDASRIPQVAHRSEEPEGPVASSLAAYPASRARRSSACTPTSSMCLVCPRFPAVLRDPIVVCA